ncbi:Hypothetical protein FKW44_014565, partial [Caligus rogercresseyi]
SSSPPSFSFLSFPTRSIPYILIPHGLGLSHRHSRNDVSSIRNTVRGLAKVNQFNY